MSLNGSIQLANNSLKAAQIGLQVVGQNIANANTPGYIRSELLLEPAATQRNGNLLLGLGVSITGVIQKIDRFLEERLRSASSDRASAETQEQAFQQLESLIGELGDTDLSTSLNSFFNSIHEVLNQPDSVSTRNLAVLQGVTLASDINRLDSRVREISADLNNRIINAGGEINDLTEQIRTLNIRIAALEGGGAVVSDAVGLRDQRGVALAKLASLVQVQVEEQPSGGVAVFAGGDYLVLEGQRRTLKVVDLSEDGLGHAELRFDKIDSLLEIQGGELEGLFTARDTILGGYLADLDSFAGTLAFEFNKVFSSGQGLKGFDQVLSEGVVDDVTLPLDETGLNFTPTSGTFDVLVKNKRTGLTQTTSVRVQLDGLDNDTTLDSLVASLEAISGISASVTGQRGIEIESDSADSEFSFGHDTSGVLAALGINTFFTGSQAHNLGINQVLRDDPAKFAASAGGIGEDANNVELLAAFLDQPLDSAGGTSLSMLYDRMISKVTQASTVTQSVAEGLRVFESALNSQQLATSGVSLDEEAVKMITYQRAFQASARYINVLAELLDVLVNLEPSRPDCFARKLMSNNITPIPTTRASEPLTRTRLLAQLQADQLGMFRLQSQLSSGRRIFVPSEDAPAALRAISLQRLIERKEQVQVNLATNQSYLAASDAALSTAASLLSDIRGSALSVAGTSTPQQRQAVIASIQRAVGQLVDIGNRNFRGRYLFSGTRVDEPPFRTNGEFVEYVGNEGALRSFSDIDMLFDSGLNGNEVFGAISGPIRGATDLNRTLDANTLLSDLRGGLGISKGSIRISDGARTSIVDLSSAVTLGDVVRLIEANPPVSTGLSAERVLTVSIKPTGLVVEIDSAGGGNLTIQEVGGGTTAGELGILEIDGVGVNPLVGGDLDPKLRLTTRIDDILGSRASGRVVSSGDNNDFTLFANAIGDEFNGAGVQIVDDELLRAGVGLTAGSEVAEYSATARAATAALALAGTNNDLTFTATTAGVALNNVRIQIQNAGNIGNAATASYTDVAGVRTLTIGIDDSDQTTLGTMIAAVETNTPFTVSADSSAGEGFNGATAVQTVNAGVISGNTGNSGGEARTLFVRVKSGSTTTEQVVAAINNEGTFTAAIDPRDAPLVKQAGKGVINLAATGVTGGGGGEALDQQSGLRVRNGGQTFDIDISTATTVEDLLNAINGAGAGVLAEINSQGTGINVRSRLSGADFSIGENGGFTATQLGLRSLTEDTRLVDLHYGLGVKREIEGTAPTDPNTFVIRRNDGVELSINVQDDETIGDVLDRINNHPDNTGAGSVLARLAQYGNGIELVDDDPTGVDSLGNPNTIQVLTTPTSIAAVYLGLVPLGASQSAVPTPAEAATDATSFAAANSNLIFSARTGGTALNGAKIEFVNSAAVGDQALVSYSSGTNTLTIDVDPANTRATTVADAVTNEVGGLFTAALDTTAGANDGSGLMTVTGEVAEMEGGTPEVLSGSDVNPIETAGVFNTLLRLQAALENNDEVEVQRTIGTIDADLERMSFARAEIGARQQGLDVLQTRLQDEDVELRSSLSTEIDVDITEAISNLTARQLAYEASLRVSGSLLQLTLLSFLD